MSEFPEFRVKRWRDVKIDAETFQTAVPKIFIAGDYRTGPTTIIEAVAEGRSAAQQIARFLAESFPGHLDRWSPPAPPGFFTESFWAERLAAIALIGLAAFLLVEKLSI